MCNPTITVKALQAELYKLKDKTYDIRLAHVIEDTEHRGITSLINAYAKTALYLAHLNDLPMLLTHYGNAVTVLSTIERQATPPALDIHSWTWLLNKILFFTEFKSLLFSSYKKGENLKTLYRRIWWFHITYHSIPQALTMLFKTLVFPGKRAELKAQILLLYAEVFKTEDFGDPLRQPLKDQCLRLLNEMEALAGHGAIVRPDTKHLMGGTETSLFVRVPRNFNDDQLGEPRRQELLRTHELMTMIQNRITELELLPASEKPTDE